MPGPSRPRAATRPAGAGDRRRAVTRVLLDSLALSFRRTVAPSSGVSGIERRGDPPGRRRPLNGLLVRLCASACDRPVLVGPAEATVVGNALVQAIADGTILDLETGRRLVESDAWPLKW